MSRDLSKLGGIIQALFGAAGQFIPGASDVLSTTATTSQGNIFNMASGVLLSIFGFQRGTGLAKGGGLIVGLINAAAGVLSLINKTNIIPGFQLNSGTPQTVVYFAIAAIGLLGLFIKKK
jgi:hypothetical protein